MTARPRAEAGFSLPEVLIAMTIMLVIMTATLTSLDSFRTNQKVDERRTEAQDTLRRGMDQLERQLRNLATPATDLRSIERAQRTDLVFQTADPQKRWVRYCIDITDALIPSGGASLWYQVSNVGSVTPPAASGCPGTGWTSTTSVGASVVNARDALNRPVFTYNWPRDPVSGAEITTDTAAITRIRTELWVDTNPGASPAEQRLSSGAYLRNQNQVPLPSFTFNAVGRTLNASATVDHEGRRLNYHWYQDTAAVTPPVGCAPPDPAPANYLGFGVVQRLPATVTSPRTVTLCVVDPGDLQATTSRTVTF